MPEVAFLLGDAGRAGLGLTRHDNHERLPRAFRRLGWVTVSLDSDALRLEPAGVRLGGHDPAQFDLIWPLGLGRADSFLDRMQLLRELPQQRLVVCVDALVYWHAKYPWWRHMPDTWAGADPDALAERLDDGDWIVKPTAGSFGRDVRRIRNDAAGRAALRDATRGGRYCLLQRYVAEVEQGEKRTLVAGGRLVGSYLRLPAPGGLTNLAAGGRPRPTTLTAGERHLVETLAADLADRGVGFAAVDTAYPYLMEVNLANPGGLATLEALYGEDPSDRVVRAIAAWRGCRYD